MQEVEFIRKIIQGFKNPFFSRGQHFFDSLHQKGTRIAVDIGAGSIKIITAEGTPQGPVLKAAGTREIPRSSEIKGAVPDEHAISQCLQDLWHRQKLKNGDVRLIISDPAVFLRQMTIPAVEEHELSKAVKWQIEKFITYPIEEASVDYQLIESGDKSEKNQIGVIVVALQRKIIERYLEYLKTVKIIPTLIDIAPFSVAKAAVRIYAPADEETLLIVDFGAQTTALVIIRGRSFRMVRCITNSGDQLTRLVAEVCGVDRATAESLKKQTVLFEKNAAPEVQTAAVAVQGWADELVKEIERSLTYCERENLVERLDKVILCGGGANLKGMDTFIGNALGLKVETAKIPAQSEINQNGENPGAQFMAAYGGTF